MLLKFKHFFAALVCFVSLLAGATVTHAQVPPAGGNIICMLNPDSCVIPSDSVITTATKSLQFPSLIGSNRNTNVTISFHVGGTNPADFVNAVVEERLANYFTLNSTDPSGFTLKYNGAPAGVTGVTVDGSKRNASITLNNLHAGDYTLTFSVQISGGTPDGTYPVEVAAGSCSDPNSRITFVNNTATSGCTNLPAGSLTRRAPKVVMDADAWAGKKNVTASNTLQIGANTLVITNGATNAGALGISGYNVPSTGKLAWQSLESVIRQRVDRGVKTQTIKAAACPAGPVSVLYLDGKTSPFDPVRDVGKKKTWVLSNCTWQLGTAASTGSIPYYGSGTIVNVLLAGSGKVDPSYKGGSLTIYGHVQPIVTTDTLGYISFGPGTGAGNDGLVSLVGTSAVQNVAVFTSGRIDIAPNRTPSSNTHVAQLVSRFITFPLPNLMESDIFFERPAAIFANVPPLFEQFYLPSGREAP